jgi:hypothetical protein
MKPIITGLLLALAFSSQPAIAQTKEIKLQHLARFKAGDPDLRSVQVLFKMDTLQPESEKGLKFSVRIKNDSAAPILIYNPIDFISISLMDKSGKDVHIPTVPKHLIKTPNRPANGTFEFEKVIQDGKEMNVDINSLDSIVLSANGTLEISFKIKRVLKPGAVKPYTTDQEIKLPTGAYRFFLEMSVNAKPAAGASSSPTVYATFRLPPLIIHYGS